MRVRRASALTEEHVGNVVVLAVGEADEQWHPGAGRHAGHAAQQVRLRVRQDQPWL